MPDNVNPNAITMAATNNVNLPGMFFMFFLL
jgi:hypothetical protein